MKKTTKGALAAGAAAVLLLGGAGTIAYWTDSADVDAGEINSGDLSLTVGTCTDWVYAATDAEGTGPATLLVPGDTVESTCSATLDGSGDHLVATVEVDPDSVQDVTIGTALEPATAPDTLDVTATLTAPAGAADGVDVDGPTPVTVTVTVAWPYGTENNGSELSTADLSALTLNAVQVHD